MKLAQRIWKDVSVFVICIRNSSLVSKTIYLGFAFAAFSSCTTGRLEYITPSGDTKFACETEYTWQPSVDRYAVEYILAYCAKRAASMGNTVSNQLLLNIDLTLATPPSEKFWTHELAKQVHKEKQLTDKEYGYIIAFLDLGHDKTGN